MPRSTRGYRSRFVLSNAIGPAIRAMFASEGDDKGGGGGEQQPPEKKPAKSAKEEKPANEGKLVLAPEELEAKLEQARKDAIAAARDEADKKRQEEKDAADRKAAEEQGKWKELSEKAEAKIKEKDAEIAALKLANRRSEVREQARQYLSDHHPDYVGAEKWILPLVEFSLDSAPEDITKRIKSASDEYVKSNPRSRPATNSPPPGGRQANTSPGKKEQKVTNGSALRVPGAAARF